MTFETEEHMVIACFSCSIEQQSYKKSTNCFIDLCECIGYSHLNYAELALEFLELNFQISMQSLIVAITIGSDTNDRFIYSKLVKILILST